MENKKGKLYIVSTPIGNLEDITFRALRVLKEVDLIACEDTRTTRKLLSHYGIKKPLTSYHEHNEDKKARELLRLLESGERIALVSDAGTPGISDPGYRIVTLASKVGIPVFSIPGSSAAVAALSVSGLPTSSFLFLGFPPRSGKRRREFLEGLRDLSHTLIFYESPKRVGGTLRDIIDILGDRAISLSRELTKVYEETLRGRSSEILEILKERGKIKGEITLVVEGKREEGVISDEVIEKNLTLYKEKGFTLKDSVKEVSRGLKVSRRLVYERALKVWGRV